MKQALKSKVCTNCNGMKEVCIQCGGRGEDDCTCKFRSSTNVRYSPVTCPVCMGSGTMPRVIS